MRKAGLVLLFAAIVGFGAASVLAQDHEHPEHPKDRNEQPSISKTDLAKAISDYIEKDSRLKGGHFLYYDKRQNRPLVLALVKVHKDKLAQTADDTYFACSDFKGSDDHLYDIDFFMKGDSPEDLEVTEISVHKMDGHPRYTWKEENGRWKHAPVPQETK